jgi:nucleoside-diphosphate-sugar epimerase
VARAALGITRAPHWGGMDDRSWDTSVWVADARAARAQLGWQARTAFADGFGRTVEWFRSRPAIAARYRARQTAA